ncbi:MAG: restriction endonuclease subunit S [Saprospiraceae bacterium]
MNQTLEAMAQSLFKEWFVNFNFPNFDGVLENGLPKGWRMGKLREEFNLTMGQSPKGETLNQDNEGMIFYQGRTDFGFRFPTNRVFTTEPNRIANKLDTLVCVRAPVGDVNMAIEKCCIGRGLSAVIHKSNAYSFTYYSMKNIEPIFKGFESEGTVFGSLNKTNFENIEIIIPGQVLIKEFEKVANSIDEKIVNNTLEIQTLTQTRDTLLPKLMSGKIEI